MRDETAQKLKAYLETTTSAAVVLVAVVVLGTFLWNYYRVRQLETKLVSGLQKESVLPPLPGVVYRDSAQTLMIAVNTRCRYCVESTSFYNRLAGFGRNNNGSLRIVAVFPNSEDEVREYIRQTQLGVATIATADFQKLNVAGTPTMILVDSQGKILDFWIGKLSTDGEQEVMRRVGA